MSDTLSDYDYELPEDLIAKFPAEQRENSRLMVVSRTTGTVDDLRFHQLPSILSAGDCLILNNTRVIPARLSGFRTQTGGKWEGLYLGSTAEGDWHLKGQTRGKLQPGETITLTTTESLLHGTDLPLGTAFEENITDQGPGLLTYQLQLKSRLDDGSWYAAPQDQQSPLHVLETVGSVPLPPYMKKEPSAEDRERYQTVYATHPGAIAAPTAGLHFTTELLSECQALGIQIGYVTLHVGMGTFLPVTSEILSDHQMHEEWCEIPQETVELIRKTKASGGKVIAVGTTSVRTLESVRLAESMKEWRGTTNLFITPGFTFQTIDALLTNFHLPKSTLIVLVCSFAGRELIRSVYQYAIEEKYRFFSYGDAMLIL